MMEINNTKTQDVKQMPKQPAKKKKKYRLKVKKRVVVPAVVVAFLLLVGIYMSLHAHYYQVTDDAFIEGHIVSVAPRVLGPVVKLYAKDNQEVKKGDLLLEIDPKDYEVALKEKEAKLLEAKAGLNVAQKTISESETKLTSAKDDLKSAKSKLEFAQKTNSRNSILRQDGIVSQHEFDKSKTELVSSDSVYNSALEGQKAANIQVQSSLAKKEAQEAQIKRLESEVDQARLNLSYTKIYSPQNGKVSSRSVEEGNFVQMAQPLMSIVSDEVWIVANYKETQLAKVRTGQEVFIKVDAFPDKKFVGKVESIQRATGAKASLFPPENAVGSYVKVVQRIPVKIVFSKDYGEYNLAPGMSVVPKIRVK